MPVERVLILGGTGEARALAAALVAAGHDVTTSLAGVTAQPILPEGKIHVGGFGGVEGLRAYLAQEKISVVIDGTHPFAAIISRNAAAASGTVPLLRLERPAWLPRHGDHWIDVSDISGAVDALSVHAKVLLTIGRKEILPFISRSDLSGVARMIEAPPLALPETWTLVLQRPPFAVADEVALMRKHDITHVISKNAGGTETFAKLVAARQLRIPVVMVQRPVKPAVPGYATVAACLEAVSQLGRGKR
ncbi:MAG: cobalt-precorrin-6A reductase [Alphaproteobacteria bacterium]|nr:cobalt-precorrin-6A reductase [Alphaproteobacteria bacterium]